MGLTNDIKQEAQNALKDIGNSYQEILLQHSPLSVKEGAEPEPEKSQIESPLQQPLEGEVLSPMVGLSDSQEPHIIDGEYRTLGEDMELPPPSLQELPAPDEPFLQALKHQSNDIER